MLLATILVAAVAVVASALLSRQVVDREFKQFVRASESPSLDQASSALGAFVRGGGAIAEAEPVLARAAHEIGRALILVDTSGTVIAASDPPLRAAHLTRAPGGHVTVEGRTRDGSRTSGLVLELISPTSTEIHDEGGARLGTLIALPEARAPRAQARPFLHRVDRGLWLGALAAIAFGAALMWLLSSRIVGPIEALTTAARQLERGDLSPRVATRGHDEVAALGRSFNAMALSLARTQQSRRQLTHDIAHELRTPLTNLRAQIEALQDGLLQPDAGTLASLHEEVMLLARLIEDLAQLALVESEALSLELVRVPVQDALERAAAATRSQTTACGITVAIDASAALAVRADVSRLGQILRNLLGNAMTHTPSGGHITLTASAAGGAVAIVVSDSGSGIAPEHLPHVFERCYRADPSRSRDTGGAGLGLAIVQQLVKAHGGEISAESLPANGTSIRFTLPAG